MCIRHADRLNTIAIWFILWYDTYLQTAEESTILLEGAVSSLTSLLIIVLSKSFTSDNLHSIFKVTHCYMCMFIFHMYTCRCTDIEGDEHIYVCSLFTLIQHLSPWTQSHNGLERNRAVVCFLEIIKAYKTHSDTDEVRIS